MPVQLTQPKLAASEPGLYQDRGTEQWNDWATESVSIDNLDDLINGQQFAAMSAEWSLPSLDV